MSLLLVLAACTPAPSPKASPRERAQQLARATGAALRAESPWMVMNGSSSGEAVWPSGDAFLLLHTSDGWQHVSNITPIAVPTNGGLTIATSSGALVVAALPFDQLVVSPLLRSSTAGTSWRPDQLPGGLTPGRHSVSLGPRGVTAVLREGGGTVVEKGQKGWSELTSASRLAPGGRLHLDGLVWGAGGRGWLTGNGPSGSPVAFTTSDFGLTWAAVGGLAPDTVAALTPCGGGQQWTMPVVRARGTMSVAASDNGGATWATGAALTVPLGPPTWGCHGREVWLVGGAADGDHVYSSLNAGLTWTQHGIAPAGLSDLVPTGDHRGFATTATTTGAVLWAVRRDGAVFSPLALPGWVATVGNPATTQD
ncbi:MAG: hypothetical protein ABI899_03635 [Actinomycetota bacterium]